MRLDWRSWTRGQWAMRAVILLGPLVAVYARDLSTTAPTRLFVVLVLGLAIIWAAFPESVVGGVTLLAVGWAWAADVAGAVPASALLAAGAMLAAHLAALVVSYGPDRLPIAPGVVRLWAARGVVVFIPAVLVWLLARGVAQLPDSRTVWVVGLAVAVSVVVVAAGVVQALTPQGDDE